MSRPTLKFVPDARKTVISELCPEEEARLLHLADLALHNWTEPYSVLPAGSRAKEDHRKLVHELEREAQKARNRRPAA